jgi:iron complex transport system substrate-binding protein
LSDIKMKFNGFYSLTAAVLALGLSACNTNTKPTEGLSDSIKIVSLNGAVSEVIAGLGLEKNVVGTDITSNFPEGMKAKPKVGHNKNINAEGVMALQPNLIIGIKKEVTPALVAQFKAAGVKLLLVDQEYSPAGTKKLISTLADSLHVINKGDSLIQVLDAELAKVKPEPSAKKPRILFIYARGTGTMMVGGTGTQVAKAIELAGGANAITEFADYKPLTAESLVKANPDIILLFDSGLQSLGGPTGLSKVQGVKETSAGKNNKIITMDGELLSSFGPRLGIAIQQLADKIH